MEIVIEIDKYNKEHIININFLESLEENNKYNKEHIININFLESLEVYIDIENIY
jgi:hypothetical protein